MGLISSYVLMGMLIRDKSLVWEDEGVYFLHYLGIVNDGLLCLGDVRFS